VAAALLAAACGTSKKQLPPRLTSFEQDYFNALFRFRPTVASAQGLHQYDGRLDNLSPLTVGARIDELNRLLARLQTLSRLPLSPDETIEAQLIGYHIRSELLDLKDRETWRRNPLPYVELPIATIDRLMRRNYAPASERLAAVITAVHETEAVMASLRTNVTHPPRPWTERAIEECQRLLGLLKTDLPRWGEQAAGLNVALKQELQAVLAGAVAVTEQSLRWLQRDLLPQSDGSFALGPEQLMTKLLFDTMTEVPLQQLLKSAEANLATDSAAFVEAAKQIDPHRDAAGVLRAAERAKLPPAEWIPAVNQSLARLRRFLETKRLVEVPAQFDVQVDRAPPYLEDVLFPARIDLPAVLAAGPRRAYYLLVAPASNWKAPLRREHLGRFTRAEIELRAMNSLLPGRYLHWLRLPDYPGRAGRFCSARFNLDGWSHYVEQMMLEEGYGDRDPELRLFQLHRALVRDCHLVAALRLHAEGMTIEQAARLFREQAFLGPELARLEAIRCTYDPGCCSGALGKMQILKLRADYARAKGAGYNLREFHERFLAQGALPVTLIRKQLLPGDQGPVL